MQLWGNTMNKNDFAVTPPMGWNSYDYYDTTVTEEQIKANADYMAKHLKQYGYEYIVVDIEWYSNDAGSKRKQYQYIPFGDDEIDEYGRFIPSPSRFPSSKNGAGFKPLATYCHELGLKFGIHIMRGVPRTAAERHLPVLGTSVTAADIADPSSICGWNPDMYGIRNTKEGQAYYDSLISLYSDWGVDFIKCDDICDSWMYSDENFSGWHETKMLHEAIMKANRPIVLSLSPGPAHIDKAFHYQKNANMWRITDDFWDKWELLKNMFWRCEMWQDHVKAGCFPDCDMLPIGTVGAGFEDERKTNFTPDEIKTMMTLWCIFGSPLMIGGELTKMTEEDLSYLTNERLLELMGTGWSAHQLCRDDRKAMWVSENKNGSKCIAVFNLSDEEDEYTITLPTEKEVVMEDIWTKDTIKAICEYKCKVAKHGVFAGYIKE